MRVIETSTSNYVDTTDKRWKPEAMQYAIDAIKAERERTKEQWAFTALMPFEMFLLNDGWKFEYVGSLNAYHPDRGYIKDGKRISLGFGLRTYTMGEEEGQFGRRNYREVNFYFVLNGRYYQVSNKEEDYQKAINGLLPQIL